MALLLVTGLTMAQNIVIQDNGGGLSEAGDYRMRASIGQRVIGMAEGDDYSSGAGFFYMTDGAEKVEESQSLPKGLDLSISPNPFNSRMEIAFNLEESGDVEIGIFSVTGNEIAGYKRSMKEGRQAIVFEADDEIGSGIYIVRVKTERAVDTERAVFVK